MISSVRRFITIGQTDVVEIHPSATQGQMDPNTYLHVGEAINSPSGTTRLTMQPDGNLVLSRRDTNTPIWATMTTGAYQAVMQPDGNLVVYPQSGPPLWSSRTNGNNGATLSVQDDGNLVIYYDGKPKWASNTAGQSGAAPEPPSGSTLQPTQSLLAEVRTKLTAKGLSALTDAEKKLLNDFSGSLTKAEQDLLTKGRTILNQIDPVTGQQTGTQVVVEPVDVPFYKQPKVLIGGGLALAVLVALGLRARR